MQILYIPMLGKHFHNRSTTTDSTNHPHLTGYILTKICSPFAGYGVKIMTRSNDPSKAAVDVDGKTDWILIGDDLFTIRGCGWRPEAWGRLGACYRGWIFHHPTPTTTPLPVISCVGRIQRKI